MKEFKGTKGPWASHYANKSNAYDGGDSYFRGFYVIKDESMNNIIDNGEIENEGDANLIAAAPELLEALQEAVEILEWMNPPPSSLRHMEATIAKALGEKA